MTQFIAKLEPSSDNKYPYLVTLTDEEGVRVFGVKYANLRQAQRSLKQQQKAARIYNTTLLSTEERISISFIQRLGRYFGFN